VLLAIAAPVYWWKRRRLVVNGYKEL
jgi:hypothetical protein